MKGAVSSARYRSSEGIHVHSPIRPLWHIQLVRGAANSPREPQGLKVEDASSPAAGVSRLPPTVLLRLLCVLESLTVLLYWRSAVRRLLLSEREWGRRWCHRVASRTQS
jgi:hypothetical protein